MLILAVSMMAASSRVLEMYLLGSRRRLGWIVSLGSQPVWMALIWLTEAYGLFALSAIMIFMAIRGLKQWSKEYNEEERS